MTQTSRIMLLSLTGLWLLNPAWVHANEETLEHATETQVEADTAAQQSQQQIDNLDDETRELLAEYRSVIQQTQSIESYNDQLEELVNSQQDELESIDEQLANIETTQRDIVPLMMRMIDVFEQFVELDVPFLPEEREQRIDSLQGLMDRADVTLAEKYRRILEAYQVETEYGRTIEAYQGELQSDDGSREVEYLRIGRVALFYLTLDGREGGVWDNQEKTWREVSDNALTSIADGIKIARKQTPPDLLVLPVRKPEAAE